MKTIARTARISILAVALAAAFALTSNYSDALARSMDRDMSHGHCSNLAIPLDRERCEQSPPATGPTPKMPRSQKKRASRFIKCVKASINLTHRQKAHFIKECRRRRYLSPRAVLQDFLDKASCRQSPKAALPYMSAHSHHDVQYRAWVNRKKSQIKEFRSFLHNPSGYVWAIIWSNLWLFLAFFYTPLSIILLIRVRRRVRKMRSGRFPRRGELGDWTGRLIG